MIALPKIQTIFCLLYLAALPLMDLPKPSILGAKIQYADIIFAFLFLSWLLDIVRTRTNPLPSKSIAIPLILLLTVNLISSLHSENLTVSMPDYAGLLYLSAIFILFSSFAANKRMFADSLSMIFLTSAAASVIGLAGFIFFNLTGSPWAEKLLFFAPLKASIAPFPRIKSTLPLPEMFISFSQLGMVSGMLLMGWQEKIGEKRIFMACVLIIILAAFLSYSRPLAGFFLALTGITVLKTGKNRLLIPLSILIAFVFVVLAAGAFLTSTMTVYPVTIHRDTDTGLSTISFYTAPDIRALLRKAALKVASENPYLGIGQGMFTYKAAGYLNLRQAKHTFKMNELNIADLKIDPHCAYFGAVAETGLLGLFSLLLFFYSIARKSIKSIRAPLYSKHEYAKLCLLAGFCGYLLNGWFTDIFALRQFWLNIALLTGAISNKG